MLGDEGGGPENAGPVIELGRHDLQVAVGEGQRASVHDGPYLGEGLLVDARQIPIT